MPDVIRDRDCGCKGCRTCLICETKFGLTKSSCVPVVKTSNSFVYCPLCEKAWPGDNIELYKEHPHHVGQPIDYPGVFIQLDFLTKDEESLLMKGIDEMSWDISQSGRRKQNFGPKTNFKKQKLRMGDFIGFPAFSQFVQAKFDNVPLLRDFQTIEQCSLEYDPGRGASIDPHIDDCWIWGERVVTVNCLSDSVLTMNKYQGDKSRYNLNLVPSYINKMITMNADLPDDTLIYLPMPRRSLIVLYGQARYDWEHSVLREHITSRRVCIAYREFTPFYLKDGSKESEGLEVLNKAKLFWPHNVEENSISS